MEAEDGADEKAITAMGLLSTIETLINCMEENPKIMEQIEPITLQVVGLILTKNVMGESEWCSDFALFPFQKNSLIPHAYPIYACTYLLLAVGHIVCSEVIANDWK